MHKDLVKVKADLKLSASDESYDGANCVDGFVHSGFLSSFTVFDELFDGIYVLDISPEFRVLEGKLGEVLHHLDLSLGRCCSVGGIGLSKESVSSVAPLMATPPSPASASPLAVVSPMSLLSSSVSSSGSCSSSIPSLLSSSVSPSGSCLSSLPSLVLTSLSSYL